MSTEKQLVACCVHGCWLIKFSDHLSSPPCRFLCGVTKNMKIFPAASLQNERSGSGNGDLPPPLFGDTFTVYLCTTRSRDVTAGDRDGALCGKTRRLNGTDWNTKEGLCIIKLW